MNKLNHIFSRHKDIISCKLSLHKISEKWLNVQNAHCIKYFSYSMFYNLQNIQQEEHFKFTTYFHFDTAVRMAGHSSVTKY
jgi:hypothetical protein